MSLGQVGHIFSKYEVVYLANLMGTNYIFKMGMSIDMNIDELNAEAEKRLLAKNYIFRDFSGKYILSRNISEYFYPFVSPDKVISTKRVRNGNAENIWVFIRNNKYLLVENHDANTDDFIFSLCDEAEEPKEKIKEFLLEEIELEEKKHRVIVGVEEYKLLVDAVKKSEDDRYIFLTSEIGIKDEIREELKFLFGENKDVISVAVFYNFRWEPERFFSILYYINENKCWKLDADASYEDNVKLSTASNRDICSDIDSLFESYVD